MSESATAPPELSKMSTEEFLDHIDKMPPKVFPGVVCAKLDAGTVTATCFKLIDGEGQALALLTTTDQGKPVPS